MKGVSGREKEEVSELDLVFQNEQKGRYLQPRIPMLSLALMWDNSSCRDTEKLVQLVRESIEETLH